jgi:hypothetical protein
VWKYLDDGSNQGTAWAANNFDDSAWASGASELGYGNDTATFATTVGYGPDANNKYITTYFRRSFTVTDVTNFIALTLSLMRDDGAVVYLNGVEVFRSNMPGGPVTYTTLGSLGVGGSAESAFHKAPVDPSLIVEGTNVLAVEIHQVSPDSSDISFDLELVGQRE